MYCPKCNKENPDDAKSCKSCGTALTQSGALSKIEKFLEDNSRKMAELYGEKFADSSRWGPDLAALLILAYIDRDKVDKLWYKQASKIKKVTGESEKKLIVYTCHTGMLAHTSRSLEVARKLRELGHEVVFIADTDTKPDEEGKPTQRKYYELIKRAGFETYHMPLQVGEDILIKNLHADSPTLKLHTVKMIEEETRNMINVLMEIKEKKGNPDIMVTDFALVSNIPAEIMDIPVAAFMNFISTDYNKSILSIPDRHPVREKLYRRGGDELVESVGKSKLGKIILTIYLVSMGIPHFLARMKLMIKEKKLLKLKLNINSQLAGDITLFPDYIAYGGMEISHRALPVGPIVWEPESNVSDCELVNDFEEFLKKDGEKPLIYVTMGSTGKLEMFKLIVKALKNMDYRVAITTGKQFDISELGKLPYNFFVIPFYPGSKICKEASLMINHGGSGSLNQAIQNRVPQIALPTFAEQQWGSDLVARHRLGKQIVLSKLSVESLSAAVEELLPKK